VAVQFGAVVIPSISLGFFALFAPKQRYPKKMSEAGTIPTVGRCAQGWRYPHHVGGRPGTSAAWGRVEGAVLTRILNDVLLFACATLFVTGIVLAAAKLLI
jgi:hypothetical protein